MSPAHDTIIFTNHARQRLSDRTIDDGMVRSAIWYPDKQFQQADGSVKFLKMIKGRRLQVVANWDAKSQAWVVISTWVRGEQDKEPLLWVLLTAPFRLVWWLLTLLFRWIFAPKSPHR